MCRSWFKFSSYSSWSCTKETSTSATTSGASISKWSTCNCALGWWHAASSVWWGYEASQTSTSWSLPSLSESDCSDLYLHSRSFSRSKTKSDEYHDTSEQNNGSIQSRWIERNIHWDVLHCEDSSGQSYDESIRIWWKKSIFSARRRRPRWQLWLLGRRRRRWSWRIPGCLGRCILDLGWQWLLMVSKKISRKKNQER